MKNKFRYKIDCFNYCELNCPKPWNHDSVSAAIWVANAMQSRYNQGQFRDADWVRDWALKYKIDYDNAHTK